MKLIICLAVALALTVAVVSGEQQQQQQRILRRVIKSTPTATNLGRIRLVTVRSTAAERGNVAEISSKEAANFGQRSTNETATPAAAAQQQPLQPNATKTKQSTSTSTPAPSTTSAPSTTTPPEQPSTTATPATTTTKSPENKRKASDRQQQAAPQSSGEVELLAGAPSSWQTMTAVEAPVAMLIATGARSSSAAASTSDLSSSSSNLQSSEESASNADFLRASSSSVKGSSYTQQSVGETFSRIRQQQQATKQAQQQQSYFYPQQQQQQTKTVGKTSQQATKSVWYQPATTTTTPRPAPIIQEQQYEQQNEQYVEQQEYGAAPLGQAEPFAFDFKTQDNSGNGQYRKEESDKNGVVRGSYGYTDANGIYRHVEYVADQNGFRANIKSNEPGLIGETQPASIQYAGGAPAPSRLAAAPPSTNFANNDNGNDWATASASDNQNSPAELALAPPDFESSHRSDRLRSPRHFRN